MIFFMFYVIVNDDDYLLDFLYFNQMKKFVLGVDVIKLVLVVSLVVEKFYKDVQFEFVVKKKFVFLNFIKLDSVIFKINVGWDFSLVVIGFVYIKKNYGFNESFILIRNRSVYGFFFNNWFLDFKDLLM